MVDSSPGGIDFAFLGASEHQPLGSCSPCPSRRPALNFSNTPKPHSTPHWLLLWVPVCLPGKPHNPPDHRPQLHPQSLKMSKKELFLMKRLSGRAQLPIAGCWQKARLEREQRLGTILQQKALRSSLLRQILDASQLPGGTTALKDKESVSSAC